MKTTKIEKTNQENLNPYYIVAFDSGAKGTRYVNEYGFGTHERMYAKPFDTEAEAKEYITQHIAWVEKVDEAHDAARACAGDAVDEAHDAARACAGDAVDEAHDAARACAGDAVDEAHDAARACAGDVVDEAKNEIIASAKIGIENLNEKYC